MARLSGSVRLEQMAQLAKDFDVAVRHSGLSGEARAVAWFAAKDSIRTAAPCYRAIAQSLSTQDGPKKPKRRRVV